MKLIFKPKANKQFQKLPISQKRKITKKIRLARDNPFTGKQLSGEFSGHLSLRAWPYRIIYSFDPNKQIITIHSIAHR